MNKNTDFSDEIAVCEYMHAHEDTVKAVKSKMPPDEELYDLAELLRCLVTARGYEYFMHWLSLK